MNIETGTVTSADAQTVVIESDCVSGCSSCASKGSCGVMQGPEARTITIENTIGAKKGDSVEWGMHEGAILISSAVLYLVPVIFLFAGIIAGPRLLPSWGDLASLVFGIGGLLLSMAAARFVSNRAGGSRLLKPVLIRVIKN